MRIPFTAQLRDRATTQLRALATAPAAAPARRELWVRRLVRSGVLDRSYYELQTGERFASDEAAARHLLSRGPGEDVSPHPLFEAEWLLEGLVQRAEKLPVAYLLEDAPGVAPGPVGAGAAGSPEGPLTLLRRAAADASAASLVAAVRENAAAFARERAALAPVSAARAARVDPPVAAAARSVTVVVPTGRDSGDLRDRLGDLAAQVDADWRAVVVGDTETVGDVVTASGLRDRIVLVKADGVPAVRLRAALDRVPEGPVAFLVPGSRWRADVLSRAVVRCRGDEFAWFSAETREDSSDLVVRTANDLDARDLVERGIDAPLAAVVVDKQLLDDVGGPDVSLDAAEDFDLVVRLAGHGRGLRAGTGVTYVHPERPVRPVSTSDPRVWEKVVVSKHLIDWDALGRLSAERVPGRVTICMPTYEDWSMTRRAVDALLEDSSDVDLEIVVLDNGSRRSVSSVLTALYHDEERVRIVRSPRNHNFSTGSNLAFAAGTGEYALFLNNDTVVAPGALDALRRRLAEDASVVGVQPLLRYPDGTVQTAGTFFNGERVMPWHFLAGHPSVDAVRAGVRRFSAVTAAALLMRADDVVALRGFDPMFRNGLEDVDLCLRGNLLRDDAHFETVLEATVFHHESKSIGRMNASVLNRGLFDVRWRGRYPASDLPRYAAAGLEALHTTAGTPQAFRLLRTSHPVVVRPPRTVRDADGRERPCLRWAIKVDSAFDEYDASSLEHGELVDAIVDALERAGQEVVVDQRDAYYRASDYLDDATITVQGGAAVAPQPGAVSFLWTTSTPARVSEDEAHSYDFIVAPGDVSAGAAGRPATQSSVLRTGALEDDVQALLDTATSIVLGRRATPA